MDWLNFRCRLTNLFQTTPTESSEVVTSFISKFHLDIVKKIVDILNLEPEEIDPQSSLPSFIKEYLFG